MTGGELYVIALQLGMQYFIPAAVLLRALYFSMRRKLPQGVREVLVAAGIAAAGALLDGDAETIPAALIEATTNFVFIAGLLTFILIYLLSLPNLGPWVDGFIGGVVGFLAWIVWVYVLGHPWAAWSGPVTAAGGAAVFMMLRGLLGTLGRLMRLAGRLIVVGAVLAAVGGVIWFIQNGL